VAGAYTPEIKNKFPEQHDGSLFHSNIFKWRNFSLSNITETRHGSECQVVTLFPGLNPGHPGGEHDN
jgi:hypothetical protein